MTPKVYNRNGLRFEISELPKPHYEKDDYCVVYFSNAEAKFLKDNKDFESHWKKKLENFLYSPLDQEPFDHKPLLEELKKKLGAK